MKWKERKQRPEELNCWQYITPGYMQVASCQTTPVQVSLRFLCKLVVEVGDQSHTTHSLQEFYVFSLCLHE